MENSLTLTASNMPKENGGTSGLDTGVNHGGGQLTASAGHLKLGEIDHGDLFTPQGIGRATRARHARYPDVGAAVSQETGGGRRSFNQRGQ